MKTTINFKNLVLSLICVIALNACNKEAEQDAIIIGTSPDNPPYEYIESASNNTNGAVVGFDIDLIHAIAAEMGKNVVIKTMEFSALVPALMSKHVDVVIAGISANDARSEYIDFSIPYASSRMSVITKADSGISSIENLTGKKLGAQLGTTWEMAAKHFAEKVQNIEIHAINNNLILVEELKNNNIDAIVLETLQAEKFKAQHPDMKSFEINDNESSFAIAFFKGSDLKDKVNEAISSLKTKGKIQELKNKWLNVPAVPASDIQLPADKQNDHTQTPMEKPAELNINNKELPGAVEHVETQPAATPSEVTPPAAPVVAPATAPVVTPPVVQPNEQTEPNKTQSSEPAYNIKLPEDKVEEKIETKPIDENNKEIKTTEDKKTEDKKTEEPKSDPKDAGQQPTVPSMVVPSDSEPKDIK